MLLGPKISQPLMMPLLYFSCLGECSHIWEWIHAQAPSAQQALKATCALLPGASETQDGLSEGEASVSADDWDQPSDEVASSADEGDHGSRGSPTAAPQNDFWDERSAQQDESCLLGAGRLPFPPPNPYVRALSHTFHPHQVAASEQTPELAMT